MKKTGRGGEKTDPKSQQPNTRAFITPLSKRVHAPTFPGQPAQQSAQSQRSLKLWYQWEESWDFYPFYHLYS